jgi:hypothetical protein
VVIRRLALLLMLLGVIGCGRSTSTPPPTATPARFKAVDEQTLGDQPAETQATFRAAHGDQANEDWNAAHNAAVMADLDAKAMLRASPNPVVTRAWAGTTTISFSTGTGVVGQVLVSINGGPEKPFALASGGSQDADWIWRGSTYEFRLYAGTHREHLLRTITVTRANDAVSSLGPLPLVAVVLLLVAGLVARAAARPRAARLLAVAFALVTTAAVLGLCLTTLPRAMDDQPFPDSFEYADAAHHLLAGEGYVTTVHENGPQPPRYPPGFSVVLLPFVAAGKPLAATPWFGAVYVLAAVITAWLLGGPLAAGLTAALVGTAPFAVEASSLLMSDALVTAVTVLLAGLLRQRQVIGAVALAGGLAVLRLSAALAVPAALLALPVGVARRAAVWSAPGLLVLGVFQWLTFGSPVRTGYDYWLPDLKTFDAAYTLERPMGDTPTMVGDALNGQLLGGLCPCADEGGPLTQLPNVLFYPAVIFGPFWVFAPPLVALVGLAYAFRCWRQPAARFTLLLTVLTWALLSVYVFQAARLVAAPAVLLTIYAAVAAARGLEAMTFRWPWRRRRPRSPGP